MLSGLGPDGTPIALALDYERIQRESTLSTGVDVAAAEVALELRLPGSAVAFRDAKAAELAAAEAKVAAVDAETKK